MTSKFSDFQAPSLRGQSMNVCTCAYSRRRIQSLVHLPFLHLLFFEGMLPALIATHRRSGDLLHDFVICAKSVLCGQ